MNLAISHEAVSLGGPPGERLRLGLVRELTGGRQSVTPLIPALEEKFGEARAWLGARKENGLTLALELRFLAAQLQEYMKRVPQGESVFLVRLKLQLDTLAGRIEQEAAA